MLPDADAHTEPEETKKVEERVPEAERRVSSSLRLLSLLSSLSPQKFGSCKVQLSSQSTCENGGKKSCKETRERRTKKKGEKNAEREKMSNPYLFCQGQMVENVEASQERKKKKQNKEQEHKVGT